MQMISLASIHSQVVIKLEVLWKNPKRFGEKTSAGENILKALADLGTNSLLKSNVCYLFINLSNISIYYKVLKSATGSC